MIPPDKFLWPHEHKRLLTERARRKTTNKPRPFWQSVHRKYLFLAVFVRDFYALWVSKKVAKNELEGMYLFNGRSAEPLANKYHFLEVAAKLGYHTPKQIMIKANEPIAEKLAAFEKSFPQQLQEFYFKPLDGFGGNGIFIFKSRAEAKGHLPKINADYVIEESLKINTEFRYIRYVDAEGNIWRMAYEKARPIVVGNGHSTIRQLLLGKNRIPEKSREIVIKRKTIDLSEVPAKNERVQLADMGFVQYGAFEKLPEKEETEALDLFMSKFISDLEKHTGNQIPLLCFDMAVLAPLHKDLNFKESLPLFVPLECQMPFDPTAYFKYIPDKLRTFYWFYEMLFKDRLNGIEDRLEKEPRYLL